VIPAGADTDRVGIQIGQVQIGRLVDSEDGFGWVGPEMLPVDEDEALGGYGLDDADGRGGWHDAFDSEAGWGE
jgi:hypothetical protein